MRFIILGLLVALSSTSAVFGQAKKESPPQKCALGLDRAPELRGLRLGVSQASVQSRFPGMSLEKPDNFGVTQLKFTVINSGATGKSLPARDKGVQPDMASMPGEERGFIIDAAKFPALKNVRRIRLRFVDGRLAYIQVAYDDSIKWESIDEFVETVAKALSLTSEWDLPADADGQTTGRELRCAGFVITAGVGAEATDTRIAAQLSVEDLSAAKIIEKRQNDLKEKAQRDEDAKRKNFKP